MAAAFAPRCARARPPNGLPAPRSKAARRPPIHNPGAAVRTCADPHSVFRAPARSPLGCRRAENDGRLDGLPPVGIAMEAVPELLVNTNSAYCRIVREGQNFKVGVVAVTHNPSMMPRDVLAGLRTKIIFGSENVIERRAVIESAAQDLKGNSPLSLRLDDPGRAGPTGEGGVCLPFVAPCLPHSWQFTI